MPPSREISVEEEVLGNIRAQRIGDHTVADLYLPDPFLRRIADRIIRDSFWERHRVVFREGPDGGAAPEHANAGPSRELTVVRSPVSAEARTRYAAYPEAHPPIRGFRAPLSVGPSDWPWAPPAEGDDPAVHRAARLVATRLATDGLPAAAAAAIEAIGVERIRAVGAGALDLLRNAGLPVDLLACFAGDGGPSGWVQRIVTRLEQGATAVSLKRELQRASFRYSPSVPEFRAFTESGEAPARRFRAQVTGGEYWGGRGAGGSQDLLRELLAAYPQAHVVVSVGEEHVPGLARLAGDWPPGAEARVTVVAEPFPVSQWAQDNGKPGEVRGSVVTLVPRYASRGEDGAVFTPAESLLAEGLAAAGMPVAQSTLLFQGGNLAVVRDPRSGERILLIGEAEIARNVTLGLTPEQAQEALTAEFGADRAVVLPAVAFHIDYEVTVRAVGEGEPPVAFVNDTAAAVGIVLRQGLTGLARAGIVNAVDAARAADALASGRPREVLERVAAALGSRAAPGGWPESVASGFSEGDGDSGPANFRVFLLALDLLAASLGTAGVRGLDRHLRSYLESFRRRDADRRQLIRRLESLGWRVAKVPSFADGALAPNYLNGIHEPGRYLMPAWGGFYRALDAAAAAAIKAVLGSVEVVAIPCAESQRRLGGLHCSVSVYPM